MQDRWIGWQAAQAVMQPEIDRLKDERDYLRALIKEHSEPVAWMQQEECDGVGLTGPIVYVQAEPPYKR